MHQIPPKREQASVSYTALKSILIHTEEEMPNWKRALLGGSAGAAAVMFLKGKPAAGVILTGIALATVASEYPEKFEELRDKLPRYVEQGTNYLDAVSRLGERLALAAERGSVWYEELSEG
jgi:hypothetical protein